MNRKRVWTFALLGLMLVGLMMPQLDLRPARASEDASAQTAGSKFGQSNYDIREDETSEALAFRQSRLQRLSSAQKRKSMLARSMQDAKDRLASRVRGLEVQYSNAGAAEIVGVEAGRKRFLTGTSSKDREKIVRDFINKNSLVYGLTAKAATQLKKIADYTNPAGNFSWVELQQEINGIPVFQGELRAALTTRGEIVRTVGRLAPMVEEGDTVSASLTLSPDAASSVAEAISKAALTIGVSLDAGELNLKEASPDGRSFIFDSGPFAEEIKVEAVYFPLEAGVVTRSWSMVLWQDTPAYYTIVDAESGELLWRKNITNEQTQTATFSVYNGDSPSPLSPTTITQPGTGFQPSGISRTSFTLISELPAFDNLGWITDGGNVTTGNNVDAGLDIASPNGIDANGRATGSPTRVFDFAYNPPPLGTDAPTGTNYRMGAVTNLFFWANRYHDRLYELGFTEPARNFQQNNFGRGGTGNDFVRAEAQDFSGTNNANFSTPPDGSLPRCQMFIWPGPTPARDGDLDQEVILHELTHGTSNRLHSNASGLNATMSGGMGEGWSDFYARSILSSADEDVDGIYASGAYVTFLVAAGLTDNYYYGIRRFPYAVKTTVGPNGKPHNPLTFADIDPNTIDLTDGAFARGPFGLGGRIGAVAVHNIGELWCMALLEVRARLIHRLGYEVGNQRMLQLVTDAMKLDPVNPSLLNARNSLLTADAASFNNEDQLDIWAGFATRGMGFGATITSLTNHNAKESFDYPIPGMESVSVADAACGANGVPDVGEDLMLTVPLTNPLAAALTNVSATVVGGGTANYGTIAPGATVSQSISFKVPADATCGDKVTVSVIVNSNLGQETKTFKIKTGSAAASFSENFDGVTAPALPAGWTTTTTGSQALWVTSTTASDTAPNAASSGFASTTGINELVSPNISISSANSQLTFRHSYNCEFTWDGGVLEISINGGAFTDILDAGGSFETGGYPFALNRTADGNTNALQSRAAWTGNSGGFITTTVNLPASAAGQTIKLRFRAGSDSSTTVTGNHWRIDSLVINTFQCASTPTTTSAAAASVQYSDQVTLSATVGSGCANLEGSVQFVVDGNSVGSVPISGAGTVTLPTVISLAAGSYNVTANYISSNPFYQNSNGSNTLTVTRENATVTPSASNPTSVKVNAGGGTASSITLAAAIAEVSDGSAGDTSNAVPVTFVLTPVGPGSPLTQTVPSGTGGGVGGTLNISATFTNVPVNVYDIAITIGGNFYTGSGNSMVSVYDPSLGFVTGGGTITRSGVLANFGVNAKFLPNNKIQGSFNYVEHRPSGDVKLNADSIQSLSIVNGTAVIVGKASLNGVGNYGFRLTIVDNGEPGTNDQFGLEVSAPNGSPVNDLKFTKLTITSGNIQVPHN